MEKNTILQRKIQFYREKYTNMLFTVLRFYDCFISVPYNVHKMILRFYNFTFFYNIDAWSCGFGRRLMTEKSQVQFLLELKIIFHTVDGCSRITSNVARSRGVLLYVRIGVPNEILAGLK